MVFVLIAIRYHLLSETADKRITIAETGFPCSLRATMISPLEPE
jgi:hypothetical protein